MNEITEAIVLVGGFGTRLRGVVDDVPKPLADVAGRPFLDWLLDDLSRQGVKRIILCTGYGSDLIEKRYEKGYKNLTILISRENKPLGTGGALKLASAYIESKHALIVNGDTFAAWKPEDFLNTKTQSDSAIIVGLKFLMKPDRYGTVILKDHKILSFHEKKSLPEGLINSGLCLINKNFINWPTSDVFSFERDILEPFSIKGLLAGVVLSGPFIDIGVPQSYAEAQSSIPAWLKHTIID